MIINREYVPLKILFEHDQNVKDLIKAVFKQCNMSKENAYAIWNQIVEYDLSLAKCTIGTVLPNYAYIKDKFKLLDELKPYDNHYHIEDVGHINIIYKEDHEIIISLETNSRNGDIVQVIKISEINNQLYFSIPANIHIGFD